MNLAALLPKVGANAETVLLGAALHYAAAGKVDTKHLDADAMAIALFALADQLEQEHPGLAEKYGWARVADVQAFTQALQSASQATLPDGLQ